MKKLLTAFFSAAIAIQMAYAGNPPQVQVEEWPDSLEIIDYQDNPVTLHNARIINSRVNGSLPSYDSKYSSWRMELVAHFDRQINKNGVTMYGQIYADGYDIIWAIIEGVTGEKTRKVWKPIEIPALQPGQTIDLCRQMLGSDFNIYYNSTKLTPIYGLSFIEWIQKFYCGIVFHSREYLGTTCTIDCVLINPNDNNDRITIDSFEYLYDGSYPDAGKNWFNARVGWYEKLPRDLRQCLNCSITDIDESLSIPTFGQLSVDDRMLLEVLSNPYENVRSSRKTIIAHIKGGKDMPVQDFNSMYRSFSTDQINPEIPKTAACGFYLEDGVTNLMGLVGIGNCSTNDMARLTPTRPFTISDDVNVITMVILSVNEDTFVCYSVNGVYFSYNTQVFIPVKTYKHYDRVAVQGCAVLTELYGDIESIGGANTYIF